MFPTLCICLRVPGRIISKSNAHIWVNEVCNCRPKPICNPHPNVFVHCTNDERVFATFCHHPFNPSLIQYDVANKTCCLCCCWGRAGTEITKHLNVMSCKLPRPLFLCLLITLCCSAISSSSEKDSIRKSSGKGNDNVRKVNKLCRKKINVSSFCNDPNTYEGPSRNVCLSQKSTRISNFKSMLRIKSDGYIAHIHTNTCICLRAPEKVSQSDKGQIAHEFVSNFLIEVTRRRSVGKCQQYPDSTSWHFIVWSARVCVSSVEETRRC